jgi:hypothetical protein
LQLWDGFQNNRIPMTKLHLPALCLWALLAAPFAFGQAPPAGVITYEGLRRVDPSQVRIIRNGDVLQPGSPDAPAMPDAIPFSQRLTFAGTAGVEEQENAGPVIRRFEGNGGAPGVRPAGPLTPPFTEKQYLDLAARTRTRVLEVKTDSATRRYCAESPLPAAPDWQDVPKTRKIAGYHCRKATCSWQGQTYILWYTTSLPFAYSPIPALTPEQGVVLAVEGGGEGFTAVHVEPAPVDEAGLRVPADARRVTPEALDRLREEAVADFRQQLLLPPSSNR